MGGDPSPGDARSADRHVVIAGRMRVIGRSTTGERSTGGW